MHSDGKKAPLVPRYAFLPPVICALAEINKTHEVNSKKFDTLTELDNPKVQSNPIQ